MTSDARSSEEIEREIQREREGLKDSVNDLQHRFSFDGVVQQIGDQFREHGGEFGRSVAQSARDNPVALALTGVGLAWMIFGNNRREADRDAGHAPQRPRQRPRDREPDYDAARHVAQAAPDDIARRGGPPRPAWARDWDRDELGHGPGRTGPSLGDRASDAGDAVRDAAESATDRVAAGAASVRDTAGDAAQGAGSAARGVRDSAGTVWSSAAQRAETLQRRLWEGTESLSEEARDRIAAARARALDARDEAARQLGRGTDRAADFYEDHPLVVGALAFAVGAAVAGSLPNTRIEDEYVGDYSDELFDEAERIYAEELEKAEKVVKAGVDEARNVAADLKSDADAAAPGDKSAAQAAADRAKSAAERVADAATSEAEKEDLGNISKDS